jgi:hypothetical protein
MSKCIHILDIGDGYIPELKTNYTIPSIVNYANKIKADINFIKERKFEEMPLLYEHMQVYEDGKDYEWNIVIDLDVLFSKYFWDVTEAIPMNCVGLYDSYPAHLKFKSDIYFKRDGRNTAINGCFVVASYLNHDIWKPLELSKDQIFANMYCEHRLVNEYCTSRNLAKYGLKTAHINVVLENQKHKKIFFNHLCATSNADSESTAIQEAKEYIIDDNDRIF